jgi:hypothetical protein
MGARLGADAAYRFARGEKVLASSGQDAQLSRPLDFVLLSDHAEFMGVFPMLDQQQPELLATELGKRWHALYEKNQRREVFDEFTRVLWGRLSLEYPAAIRESVWSEVVTAADRYNEPGKFTAFIGFEWSSLPEGNNLHRNIIFRDDAQRTLQVAPFSALDSMDPERLWDYLERYERETGGSVLAIPHNGNLSNGLMFSDRSYKGTPLSSDYARRRARWEPLYEVTQIKGDGEAHPLLSPDDAFADYETWDASNLAPEQPPKQPWMLAHEYARSALKLGLGLDRTLGQNPFRFGMIGSSDSHTGLAAVEENNFWGKFTTDEPSPRRIDATMLSLNVRDYAASGYAAVWATDNTREALFDAMQRRETYASTGPRIALRFFGGWDFASDDHLRPDYVRQGYLRGVPMGSSLPLRQGKRSPRFLVAAARDPEGANLERVQIIKGWIDKSGKEHERVYDVAMANERGAGTGATTSAATSVDVSTATYLNTIGDVQLATVWEDPDFDPGQHAFYYVRVIEIPTPRWTTFDAAAYRLPLAPDVPMAQQERAYSSPIWYIPPGEG